MGRCRGRGHGRSPIGSRGVWRQQTPEPAVSAGQPSFTGGPPLRQGTDMNITRAIAVAACGLGLASCGSMSPNFDFFASKPANTVLTVESNPPGADASASVGGSCRTPCTLSVPAAGDLTVSYALNGYAPQTLPVRSVPTSSNSFFSSPSARLDPNPVFAELQKLAPPPKPPPPVRRRPRPPSPPPPPAVAQPMQPLPPPPGGGFGPPPNTFTPGPIR
jgi:hypothetical protein